MNLKPLFTLIAMISIGLAISQNSNTQVHISDIEHFWKAYDSIHNTPDKEMHQRIMKEMYTDKATGGLEAFMVLRKFDEKDLVASLYNYPKFWESIRENTWKVTEKKEEIEKYLTIFKTRYPEYREAGIYFCITAIRSGGTTKDSLVLIGAEIATGNYKTNVSEFPDKRLENFFKTQKSDNIVPFVIHEYVHTQQKLNADNVLSLLGQSILEGACDFITELVLGQELQHLFLVYGRENEARLKTKFKKDMFSTNYEDWLYNGRTAEVGDLGYFMGYAICKAYYEQEEDKIQAIADIINLDYADQDALKEFLKKSKYLD